MPWQLVNQAITPGFSAYVENMRWSFAIAELHRLGKRVPDDVAVVGYDDIAMARYCQPPLTTVRQPIEAAGKALIDMLMAQLAGDRPPSVQLQTELVQRATTRAVALPTAARTKPASAASRRSR